MNLQNVNKVAKRKMTSQSRVKHTEKGDKEPLLGDYFTYIKSVYRGKDFLVVFIQIVPVHSRFDIELC